MPLTANTVMDVAVNPNVKKFRTAQTGIPSAGDGYVPSAVAQYVTAIEQGFGMYRQTKLVIRNLPLTVTDTLAYLGTQVYQFPKGSILILGGVYNLSETTTSALASTINAGVNMNTAVGTTAASNITLATTMINLVAAASVVTSATVNVPGAEKGSRLAAIAYFDGTTTPVAAYLNVAFATITDIDGDGTLLMNGHVTLTWINQGAYSN